MSWSNNWTPNKIKRLCEMYRYKSNPEIARELGMTVPAVVYMARRQRLKKFVYQEPLPPGKAEKEIEALQDRVEELEYLLGAKTTLPAEFGLKPIEMKVLSVILNNDIVNQDKLHTIVYGGRPESDQPEPDVIKVHICNIRRKILPAGYSIGTVYSVGWYMDRTARSELKAICERRVAA